jgi:hypothetical protein
VLFFRFVLHCSFWVTEQVLAYLPMYMIKWLEEDWESIALGFQYLVGYSGGTLDCR